MIDSIRYISGEIKEVQALSTRGFINDVDDFNVDDALVMNFQLESGAIGTVQTSCFKNNTAVAHSESTSIWPLAKKASASATTAWT